MTVVSSIEFANHQQKYFNLALSEEVFVKSGKNMFHIAYEPTVEEQAALAPDDDFRRALSVDEFRERLAVVLDKVDKKYAKKCV